MNIASSQDADLNTHDDIAALKHDVGNPVEHLKTGVANGAQIAASRIDHGWRRLYRNATAEGDRAVAATSI